MERSPYVTANWLLSNTVIVIRKLIRNGSRVSCNICMFTRTCPNEEQNEFRGKLLTFLLATPYYGGKVVAID